MTGRVVTDTPSSMHVVCPSVLEKRQNAVKSFLYLFVDNYY